LFSSSAILSCSTLAASSCFALQVSDSSTNGAFFNEFVSLYCSTALAIVSSQGTVVGAVGVGFHSDVILFVDTLVSTLAVSGAFPSISLI